MSLPRLLRFSLWHLMLAITILAGAILVGRYWYMGYHVPRTPIAWREYSPDLIEQLRKKNRKAILHYEGTQWTLSQLSMRSFILETPPVRMAIYEGGYLPVLVDVSTKQQWEASGIDELDVGGVPVTAVINDWEQEPIIVGDSRDSHVSEELLRALRE